MFQSYVITPDIAQCRNIRLLQPNL